MQLLIHFGVFGLTFPPSRGPASSNWVAQLAMLLSTFDSSLAIVMATVISFLYESYALRESLVNNAAPKWVSTARMSDEELSPETSLLVANVMAHLNCIGLKSHQDVHHVYSRPPRPTLNTSTVADLPDQPVFNALSSLMKYYGRNGKGQREPLKKEFIEKGLGTTCSGRGSTKYWLDATQAGLETAVVVLKFRHGQHKDKTVEIRAHIDEWAIEERKDRRHYWRYDRLIVEWPAKM